MQLPNFRRAMRFARLILPALLSVGSSLAALGQVASYSFNSVQGTYTPITPDSVLVDSTDDGVYRDRPIGFSFNYNGVAYTRFSVSANGFIALGSDVSSTGSGAAYTSFTNSSGAALSGTGSDNVIAAFNMDLASRRFSRLGYAVQGTAPNRTLVVEWKNFCLYNQITDTLNFQIRLSEGSNAVSVAYGYFNYHSTRTFTAQVGLRGNNNTQYNNRTTTTDWAASTAGTRNSAGMAVSPSIVPPAGLIYTWSPSPDVAVVSASIPAGACTLGASETLFVRVRNAGSIRVDSVEGRYSINGAAPVTQRWAVTLNPGDSATRSFTQTLNLAANGNYSVVVVARAIGEVNSARNDTARIALSNQTPITSLPFVEGFDSTRSLPLGWTVRQVTGTGSWTVAGPRVYIGSTTSGSTTINTVVGAGAAFYNTYSNSLQGVLSRLITPCFDFTGSADTLLLELSYLQTGNYLTRDDSIQVQASTDGGATFTRLKGFYRPNSSVSSGNGRWTLGQVDISAYANRSGGRFGFMAGGANGDNTAIDFVRVKAGRIVTATAPRIAKATVTAYPNPTTGRFSLRGLPASRMGAPAQLVDVSGKTVRTLTLASELSLEGLPAGLYTLQAEGLHAQVVRAE